MARPVTGEFRNLPLMLRSLADGIADGKLPCDSLVAVALDPHNRVKVFAFGAFEPHVRGAEGWEPARSEAADVLLLGLSHLGIHVTF